MGKSFKVYNHASGKWETAASGNASGLIVTDPRLLIEGEVAITVEEALARQKAISDRHANYIAWLVEHGGGGSGGGGGSTGDAKITITNGDIVVESNTNYLYSTSVTNIRLQYLITSSKNNKRYFINVSLDGNIIIKDREAWTNTPGVLIIPKLDQYTSNSNHSVVITATDTDGFAAESYLLNVVEASIKLSSKVSGSTATVGIDYFFTYTITSKIIGSVATLVVTNVTNGATKTIDLGVTTSTVPRDVNVNLWDLGNIIAGSSYTIQAQTFTDMSGSTVQSDIVTNRVVIEDGVNLVTLIEGITTKKEVDDGAAKTKFSQGGNISFAFTPYLAGVSLIYYAVRLEHNGVIRDIGYFDTGKYNDNQYVQRGKQQVFSWAIPTEGDILGDWNITLRCWSEKGDPITNTELLCQVVPSSQSLISDQNPNNSTYASWNIRQESFPQVSTSKRWISNIPDFTPPGALVPVGAVTNIDVYNSNGVLSGFLTEKGQSMLRMSGESYGIIDVAPFNANADNLDNWSRQGFSMSFTFRTDKHPFANRTVFFCGDYNTDEQFSEGIKIGLEDITWSYTDGNIKETMTCKIQQGIINTVDFVVNKNPDKKAVQIFINGVLNIAREIKTDFTWKSSSKIYLGCDISNSGHIQNFSDVNFYDIKLVRSPFTDKEIVINYMNAKARATLLEDGSVDFVAYNSLKLRNFFSTSDNSTHSTLWDDINQKYANVNFNSLISDTTRTLPLDIMLVNCANTGFTRAVFEAIGGENNIWYSGCTMSYYSPSSGKSSAESTTDVDISKQGTSTMNNLIKNLEIRMSKMLKADDGSNLDYELFQPKDTWFPERQFTLKADVVDSSHANNASIGKWLNDNSDILFEKTPPMEELEARRPVDTREPAKVHDKVTIKQTLEGFPVILLIQFDGEETQTMLGIYSFNLGRGSYYNMGYRFLKDFTTKITNSAGEYVDNPLPAFVTSYHAYGQNEKFGSIDQQQVYVYEFGENANTIIDGDKTLPLALFMQDDISIIKHVGEFKYNGGNWLEPTAPVTDDNVWATLQELFSLFAQMTSSTVKKYVWNEVSGGYIETDSVYPGQSSWSTLAAELETKFSIRNGYAYFLCCIVNGLVDSLGKNMQLVCYSINGTKKWFVRFYDMDTGNGLDNVALESVAKTAYLDTFANNPNTDVNSLIVNRNDPAGGFDTYSSRMWDVFRDSIFINTGVYDSTFETLWELWRNNANVIKDVNHYIDNYFAAQTRDCGELLYNYDYNVKYLTAYITEEGGTPSYANIEFLHGTRVEYVRDWLKKRWWFFDGVFRYANVSNLQPYNTKGTFSAGGSEATNPTLVITSNIPSIFVVNVGNTGDTRYYLEEGIPTTIKLPPISSFNTQITINNTPQINDIEGLREMRFQRFMATMKLPSFSKVDLSNADTLSSSPIPFETVFINNEDYSDVRHIDISNTKFWSGSSEIGTFTVNIEKYTKLKDINISNSVVTSMSLPNASLASLNITNSNIETLSVVNQPFLDRIDFTGCRRLKSVTIDSCDKIIELNLSNLGDLHTVNITNCPNLKTIVCNNNVNLTTFNVSNCNGVNSINLYQCTNNQLNVYIVGAPNISSLNLGNTNTTKVIQVASSLPNLRTLDIRNTNLNAIQYGNAPIGTYKDEPILDVSKLNLTNFYVTNASGVCYFKFDNNKNKFKDIGSSYFSGCINLKRVFGHIRLTGTSIFNNCNKFYIREVPEGEVTPINDLGWEGADTNTANGKTDWNNNINLGTNITIGTNSIYSDFRGTACGIHDCYYILSLCDNVVNIADAFNSCRNIKFSLINSPHPDMFIHCGKVTSANSLFWGCSTGDFIIRTPDRNGDDIINHNGLFSPLISLDTVNSMFYFGGTVYVDWNLFSKLKGDVNWKIHTTDYMFGGTIRFIEDSQRSTVLDINNLIEAHCPADKLLRNLTELTYIGNSFNDANIAFNTMVDDNNVEFSPLLYNNTKLLYIINSFNNLRAGKGNLINFLGGQVEGQADKFPRALYGLYNSFNNMGSIVVFPIHNSMFRRIKTSLKYITSSSAINASSSGCFSGSNKIFLKEEDEVFPYDVFTGCINLIEIPGFFREFNLPVGTVAQLPGDSFKTNNNLTNISYLYSNMRNIRYSLTSKGFINCNIVNAAYCFEESDSNFIKKGMIPYGLFEQRKLTNVVYKGWTDADATKDKVNVNFGIDAEGNWIPDAELPMPVPTERTYTYTINKRKPTIVNMEYCLKCFQSSDAEGYTMDYGTISTDNYGDLVVPNEDYNNISIIVNPNYSPAEFIDEEQTIPNPNRDIRRFIANPAKDPYVYSWNIYAYDGLSGLYDIIEASSLYAAARNGTFSISTIIPSEFNDPADKIPPQNIHANKSVMNYICPPDMFATCVNSSNTKIVGTFYYGGRGNGNPMYNYYDYGLRGRPCPYLFKPISNITDISNLFALCVLLNPYKWNDAQGNTGQAYSSDFFAYIPKLIKMNNTFYFTIIPDKVNLEATLFINNINLQEIASTWLRAEFRGSANSNQVDPTIFARNTNLKNISYAFASGVESGDWTARSPKLIDSQMFNANKHKNIVNCTGVFWGATASQGSLPEFWTWLNSLSSNNRANTFYGMSRAKFTNGAAVPAAWANGMNA